MLPARAAAAAIASAACRAGRSRIAASAAIIHMTASGDSAAIRSAAAVMAGALLRPQGSSTMRVPWAPARRMCSPTRKRCSSLQTTNGGAKPGPIARRAVSSIIERSETSGQNCLGKLSRDTGHNRVPEPPERMTGTMRNESRIADRAIGSVGESGVQRGPGIDRPAGRLQRFAGCNRGGAQL